MQSSERLFDELLVLHAQNGDMRALQRLAARWQPRLLRSARRFTGDDELAREAVQESWIGIVRGLGRLRDTATFPAWAFAILRRRCAEHVRAHAASRARSAAEEDANDVPALSSGDDQMSIAQAFVRLPEEQRVAAALFFVEQLRLDEIAMVTGAPLGTVKSRIFAARKSLKSVLNGEGI